MTQGEIFIVTIMFCFVILCLLALSIFFVITIKKVGGSKHGIQFRNRVDTHAE